MSVDLNSDNCHIELNTCEDVKLLVYWTWCLDVYDLYPHIFTGEAYFIGLDVLFLL